MSRKNILQITDLGNGNVQVSWQTGNSVPRPCDPIHFDDPLTVADHVELRWYLEGYLQFPYGAERYRAEQVETKMDQWGEALFEQVFIKLATDPDPRAFYQEAVRTGLEQCELCIVSDDHAFLNIPWELMRDSTPGRGYLAPLLAGFYRQRIHQKIEEPAALSPTQPFRVLLVIARPYGERDVPLGTIARPMTEALRSLRPRIELEVLRPPTFDELQKRLNANRGSYNLVHFDGHGVFAAPASGPLPQFSAKAEFGHLAFEKEDGSEDIVNSQELGQALATCKVPLFVLNACQSAQEGKADPFGSVASQLLAVGARGVVAMSYSVYATTASRFIKRFYESLAQHNTLAEAVAAARLKLYTDAAHDSVVGQVELRDWMVPVLYQQEQRFVPVSPEAGTEEKESTGANDAFEQASTVLPARTFGFIGRDYDILRIERAMRSDEDPWVLLSGIGGVGKTELARGFARWFAETGGCPGGVFATEFEKKADFAQVIGSIVGFGTEFSSLPEKEQERRLIDYLRKNACLLVWDNFEPVAGYPEGSTPRASDEEREKLARFLQALRGGKSRVLITTRKTDERWLGVAYRLIAIRGLNEWDAAQLAKKVLQTVGRTPEDFKNDPDYSRLISLLNGHARSIEVVLPQLEKKRPAEIIEALQHRVSALGEAMEDASLAFAFSQMSERARKHLPLIGLFTAHVDASLLGTFMNNSFYRELFGEALDSDEWESLLAEAARCGLLRSLGSRVYELHPTLPVFLRRQLVAAVGEAGFNRLDSNFLDLYAALSGNLFDAATKADPFAVAWLGIEEGNLLRALRIAEKGKQSEEALAIIQTIGEFYEVTNRADEWRTLRIGLLDIIGRELPANADFDRAKLWTYLISVEAREAIARGELGNAELAYRQMLDYLLLRENESGVEHNVRVTHHQLGIIAHERLQFDLAEQWYRKALETSERLGLEREAATEYHHLGMIAEERQQLDLAEQWYKKSLDIFKRLGFERDAATDYHHLGRIALERQQFDVAEEWHERAVEICERLGLERDSAYGYHQLGIIAGERGRFDLAEEWYRKALSIRERCGLDRDAASDYHQLGMIAEERQQFDLAEQWYEKALSTKERFGLELEAASEYHHLGRIAQDRHDFDLAEQWYKKALETLGRPGHPPSTVNSLAQMGVLRLEQERLQESVVWFGKAWAITAEYQMRVGERILGNLAGLMKFMGESEFVAVWQKAFGEDPPIDLLREAVKQV